MPVPALDLTENHLLAALPQQDRERWRSGLDSVVVVAGQVLHHPGQAPREAYFPLAAVVSLQIQSAGGECDEVAVVGREGMVGVATLTADRSQTMQAVVQSGGRALRMSAERIRAEVGSSPAASRLLLQYLVAQDRQLAQGVVCSRHHSVAQRLAVRLLLGIESQQASRLMMTHEQLSCWLGVRRESVAAEAKKLQTAGLIEYSRGRITVLDRAGLEQRSCECLSLITAEYRRLRPGAPEPQSAWSRGLLRPVARADPECNSVFGTMA